MSFMPKPGSFDVNLSQTWQYKYWRKELNTGFLAANDKIWKTEHKGDKITHDLSLNVII